MKRKKERENKNAYYLYIVSCNKGKKGGEENPSLEGKPSLERNQLQRKGEEKQ